MVHKEELRLNNWVRDYYGISRQVAYIGETVGLHNDCGGTDRYEKAPIWSNNLKDLHGIPLTADLLVKAGTVEGRCFYTMYKTPGHVVTFVMWANYDGEYHFAISTHDIHVKYLHQLQNLYFALTGTELNIDLNTNNKTSNNG